MTPTWKSLSSVFLFTFFYLGVHAQTQIYPGQISGKLLDEKSTPQPYLTVNLYQAKDSSLVKGSITNDKGDFVFSEVADGAYLIGVQSMNYHKKFNGPFLVDPDNKHIMIGTIHVQSNEQQLALVTVTARKPLIERKDNKVIMNISGSTLAAGNTALEIIAKAPGVSMDNEGNLSLRGRPGVTVMIDGKLTYLSTPQLTNLLRTTSGTSIQSIEIISNPSSKYDATGTGGIINIKLKKNSEYGTNGTLTTTGGYGNYYKSEAGLTLNNRSRKVNFFGNYNYSNNKDYEDLVVTRSSSADNKETYFDQQGKHIYSRKNNNYKAGIDYYLTEKSTLGLLVNGYVNTSNAENSISTLIGSQPLQKDSSIIARNRGNSKFRNLTYNLNYKAVIDTSGQELTADFDYSQFRNSEQTTYTNYFYDANDVSSKLPLIFRNSTPTKIKIIAAKADYTYPFDVETKLETGVKSSYASTNNDFRSEAQSANGGWIDDLTKSNIFSYKEQVSAAYANLHKEISSTALQIGLRAEHTHSEGNSITLNSVVKRNYLDFFPSLSVQQTLSDDQEIGISYSRRIDRPDYQSLNPFVYYADLYTFSQGNPALKPQYASSLDLTYRYKRMDLTVGYIHTKDVITTTILTDTIKKTLLLYEQNLASRSSWSINVSRPIMLTHWWNTSNDATLFYSRFSSPDLMGLPFENGKLTFNLNTTQSFAFNSSLNADLSASYTSSQVYGTYIAKPIYGVDLGLSKSFMNKKASIKLAANDIFNQREIQVKSAIPLQDYHLTQKQESRIFRLTFTYNFGNSSIKAARERSGSTETEQNRVKSGN